MIGKEQEIIKRIKEYYPTWFNGKNDSEAKATFEEDLDILQKAIDDLELLQQQKQISDVEKIADNEREMNAIEKISKLEKALDKACDVIANTNNHFTPKEIQEEKLSWKEYLLSEVSND